MDFTEKFCKPELRGPCLGHMEMERGDEERRQSAEGSNDEKTGNLRTGERGLRKAL